MLWYAQLVRKFADGAEGLVAFARRIRGGHVNRGR
jgi:hypothetical protein